MCRLSGPRPDCGIYTARNLAAPGRSQDTVLVMCSISCLLPAQRMTHYLDFFSLSLAYAYSILIKNV